MDVYEKEKKRVRNRGKSLEPVKIKAKNFKRTQSVEKKVEKKTKLDAKTQKNERKSHIKRPKPIDIPENFNFEPILHSNRSLNSKFDPKNRPKPPETHEKFTENPQKCEIVLNKVQEKAVSEGKKDSEQQRLAEELRKKGEIVSEMVLEELSRETAALTVLRDTREGVGRWVEGEVWAGLLREVADLLCR